MPVKVGRHFSYIQIQVNIQQEVPYIKYRMLKPKIDSVPSKRLPEAAIVIL